MTAIEMLYIGLWKTSLASPVGSVPPDDLRKLKTDVIKLSNQHSVLNDETRQLGISMRTSWMNHHAEVAADLGQIVSLSKAVKICVIHYLNFK